MAETCDNIEPSNSPIHKEEKFTIKIDQNLLDKSNKFFQQGSVSSSQHPGSSGLKNTSFPRSESRDSVRSVTSTHSDTVFEKVNRHVSNGIAPLDFQMNTTESTSVNLGEDFDGTVCASGQQKGKFFVLILSIFKIINLNVTMLFFQVEQKINTHCVI